MLDGEHLHMALLMQKDGLIPKLLKYMNVDATAMIADVEEELEKLPKVSGNADNMYSSRRLSQLLMRAEKIAEEFKDEYVSVEHLYLALLEEKGTPSAKIFSKYNINKNKFLEALSKVRGNQRVTSQNPEDNYDALNNTVAIWWKWPERVSWIRLSVVTLRFVTRFRSFPEEPRTIRC